MAAARRVRRVAASQPGFLSIKSSTNPANLVSSRRKRVNKNKKKNWNKYSDIQDVEEFLDDVRLQERTSGGLLSDKPDGSLFFIDAGSQNKTTQKATEAPVEGKKRKGKDSRPLRIDLILQHDSLVPPPKDILSHQKPNSKKLRRIGQKAERLAAKGVVPRKQRQLLNRNPAPRITKTTATEANNNPGREFYNMWGEESESKKTDDSWYLEQTGKKQIKRPEKMNEKPSVLPAVEVIAPGGSYNPDFFSHQALLLEAHEVEVKKQKEEEKLQRKLAYDREDMATEETVFNEQVEGLLEEEEGEEPNKEEEHIPVGGATALTEKKTEKQRKREKADKIKEQKRFSQRQKTGHRQQLFQLRSIKSTIKLMEEKTKQRQKQRKANQEAQKALPRRIGRLKFQPDDLEVQLSNELAGSLRRLKPEGSILKDRFKSLQKRNLIEPRERAKFKRRHKLKYVEKRSFKAIT